MKPEDEKTIRRYLLRELGEEERESVEKRLMTDHDFFRHICIAESEIIEEYARGALSDGEREKFERNFLTTPEDRQQISFNLAFKQYLSEEERDTEVASQPTLLSSLAAFWQSQRAASILALTLAILLAAASVWLIVREQRRQSEFDQLQAQAREIEKQLAQAREQGSLIQKDFQSAQEKAADLERQLAELKNKPGSESGSLASAILSVLLAPGVTRDSGPKEIKIPTDKKTVEFILRLPSGGYRSYNAEINKQGGQSFNRTALEPRVEQGETRVILRLPVAELADGDYTITIFGITDGKSEKVETYYFTAVKD